MAVPTIISLDSTYGPAVGGYRVNITGTNFKIPTVVIGIPVVEDIPTVQVTFNGVACETVKVLSTTEISVVPPWFRGSTRDANHQERDYHDAVDVVVTNLDASGVAIPGETATLSDGYSYERWRLGPPQQTGAVVGVCEAWIERLRREVCKSVNLTYAATYTDATGIVVDTAELPSISMTMRLKRDREVEYQNQGDFIVDDPNDSDRYLLFRGLRSYIVTFDLIIAGQGFVEAMSLCEGLQDSIEIEPYLSGPANTDIWPNRQYEQYNLEVAQEPVQLAGERSWNLVSFSMEVDVQGVRVMPESPRERLWTIDKFYFCDRATGYREVEIS